MPDLNWLAVAAAAVVFFVLGAAWYARPVLAKPWKKAAGLADDYASKGSQPAILAGTFVLFATMATLLAWITDPLDFAGTVLVSLVAGLGWATLSVWMLALFERKPFMYVLINGGYLTVGFLAMGVILGAWK